jgi:hypothetical protein
MPKTNRILWTRRAFDFRTAIDNTLPIIPSGFDFEAEWVQTIDGGANPAPGHILFGSSLAAAAIMSTRDVRLRRATVALITHAQVTGPAAAATIDVTVTFGKLAPPYSGGPSTVEAVGPLACPVGSAFAPIDFDFAVGSKADKGDFLTLSLGGLSNAVLGASPGSDISMIQGLMTFEWELFDGT